MSLSQVSGEATVDVVRTLGAFLPRLLAAVGLGVLGWLVARLGRFVSVRLLRGWGSRVAGGVGRVLGSREAESQVRQATLQQPVADAVGRVVFWLLMLLFLAAATEALGLPVISAWLSGVAAYLPRLLAAVLVLLLGLLAGGLVRSALAAAAASARLAHGDLLGRVGQLIVLMASAIVGFDQLGVHVTFLTVVAGIVTGALLGGAALAFGLGARTAVGNIIAAHYLLKTYKVGHHVRIGEFQGHIVEITPTSVVIATAEGQALVPAKEFSERASVLLTA
jgi:hypothetical protein